MADGALPVVVSPEPFGRDSLDLLVVEGMTVRAMLVEAVKAGLSVDYLDRTEIYVNGERLERACALDYVLKASDIVNVVVEPLGGGGGRKKNIGQILLTVAVIAVSTWVGGGAGGAITNKLLARVLAATVQVVGSMAVNAIFKPEAEAQAKVNDRYALQTAANQYRPWGPMPLALGEVVVAPDLAVKTFTQTHGDEQWMYGILALHYGACEISELKIGDTLVSSMGAGDFRMKQHLSPGARVFEIYPNDVDQLDLNEELKATINSSTTITRAASAEGERFDIDFILPGGLHFAKDDGRLIVASVSVGIRYRPLDANGVPSGDWVSTGSISRSGATRDPIRFTHSISLPLGRYEFEFRRSWLEDNSSKRQTDIAVTAIKAIAFRKPVVDETLSIIEFAVRATAVNQGGLAPMTCRIRPIVQTWTGSGWSSPQATSNPAALTRWLLSGPAAAKPVAGGQVDVRLRRWAQLCDQYNWSSHLYLTEARTQSEVLALLERAGRAGQFWDGTQIAAVPWVEKPVPRQLFTGANLRDHSWEIVYPEPVHALRIEFANLDKGGETDELMVYADGYGAVADPVAGIEAASLIEAMSLDHQARPEHAYRDGRWALGQRQHQRRVDTWTADAEHLVCQYGDRVRLAWRQVNGSDVRVRCRRWAGGLVTGLRLTQPVEMVAGVDYAVDLRTAGGLYHAVPVQTVPGVTREIQFASPRPASLCPTADDLIAFGVADRVSEDVEIVGIQPGKDLSAVLTGVRYVAPLLMAGETGPIPPLTSRLTGDRSANPPMPRLLGVQQDANGVRVSFDMPPWKGAPISGFSCRWMPVTGYDEVASWQPLPVLDAVARCLITPPLRELPTGEVGQEATKAAIEIMATTVDGRASKPLRLTVTQPVPTAPDEALWRLEVRPAAADGTSQPVLVATRRPLIDPDAPPPEPDAAEEEEPPMDPRVAQVQIRWGLTATGPWNEDYLGPPLTQAREISGLVAGVETYVQILHLSAQGVPSLELVLGPAVPLDLVAGGVTPGVVDDILGRLDGEIGSAVAEAEARQAQALADAKALLEAADATTNAALAGLSSALDHLSLEDLDGFLAYSGAIQTALDGKATNGTVEALTTRINTAEGTLTAQNGRLNTVETDLAGKAAATDLVNLTTRVTSAEGVNAAQNTRLNTVESDVAGKAAATEVNTLKAEVQTARNGSASLHAQLTGMRQAVTDGLAGKASSSDLAAQSAQIVAQGLDIAAHTTRLNTVEADVAGKASASSLTNLTTTVNGRPKTYVGSNAPGEPQPPGPRVVGDIWIMPNLGNRSFAWTGTSWVEISDARVAQTAGQVITLESTVGGHQSAISDLQTGKASASDLATASAQIAAQGATIAAHSTRLTNVEAKADGAASALSVNNLTTRVGGIEATAASAMSTAIDAQGKANAAITNQTDVNGVITGTYSVNDGVRPVYRIKTDVFELVPSSATGARLAFANGKITITAANNVNVVELGLGVAA